MGPCPWAPHQKTNTIIFKGLKHIQRSIRGMLHPFPLKITPSSVFLFSTNLVLLFCRPFLFSSFCSNFLLCISYHDPEFKNHSYACILASILKQCKTHKSKLYDGSNMHVSSIRQKNRHITS